MSLNNKIDFAVILEVKNANPNGDPLNGNRPRTDYDNYGEISDVCLKRKIRDRLLEIGHSILIQSEDRKSDEATSIRARAEKELKKESFDLKKTSKSELVKIACEKWFDVRSFGQLFAFKNEKKKNSKGKDVSSSQQEDSDKRNATDGDTGVSIPIRGPVSLHSAFSVEPVNITSTQITKSVSGEDTKDGRKGSDTMGMKHRVDRGVYVFFGSMNPQLAERTGFSNRDAEAIKSILPKLFENDASSARPEGSMRVVNVFWWEHNSKAGQMSSAKVHGSLKVNANGTYSLADLEGLEPEILVGF